MVVIKEMSEISVSNSYSSSDQAEGSDYEAEGSGYGEGNIEDSESSDDVSESSDDNESVEDVIIKNEGWADSIAKILGSSKPKNKKTLVLSRAKKLADTVKREKDVKPSFEVVGVESTTNEVKTERRNEAVLLEPPQKKKKLDRSTVRIKPNILEKDRERLLTKIATKGVVQLFNAVRNQQKTIESETKDASERKKEKILKKFDKRTFLDNLMGKSKSIVIDEQTTMKDEVKSETEKPRWNALRDDFMMGAKMKDWDKESVDD